MPFGTGFFKFLIHSEGTCLGGAAHCKLHDHDRETQNEQAKDIDQNKSAAAELTRHPWEFPNVAASYGASGAEQNEAQAAAESFSTVFHTNTSLN